MGKLADNIMTFFVLCFIFGLIAFLGYMWYQEYQLEKEYQKLLIDNNGSCIEDFPYRTCSYSKTQTVINSNSECFINDIKVNCSEINLSK